GAVLASERIVATLAKQGGFTHGFTFSHDAVTAAAALKTLDILEGERLVARAAESGAKLLAALKSLESHPHVGDVRGVGMMLGLELVADKATRAPFPRKEKRAEAVFAKAFEQGLVTYPGGGCADGVNGDSFMIAPPFVITDAESAELVAIL